MTLIIVIIFTYDFVITYKVHLDINNHRHQSFILSTKDKNLMSMLITFCYYASTF